MDSPDPRLAALGDRILIFIEVALTSEMSTNVQDIILSDRQTKPIESYQAAIFYSINNCQKGLRGISFGNFLIKEVVAELQRDFPSLSTFSTLSPVPGFARWLRSDTSGISEVSCASWAIPLFMDPEWRVEDADDLERETLMQLCTHYLVDTKARDDHPLDPVARFHLGNGARLEQINWLADSSARGRKQSFGIMVNYLYQLDELEKNHEAFHERGQVLTGVPLDPFLPKKNQKISSI